jgi:small-conductance mechanosensitive channel
MPDTSALTLAVQRIIERIQTHALTPQAAMQMAWVVAALAVGFGLSRSPVKRLAAWASAPGRPAWLVPAVYALADVLFPAFSLLLLLLYAPVAARLDLSTGLTEAAASLGLAWIVIRFSSALARKRTTARAVATVAWVAAAMHITGLLEPIVGALDAVALTVGGTRISVLTIVSALGVMALFVAGAVLLARLIEKQLGAMTTLSPSMQVLVNKLIHTVLVTIAVLIGLNTVGVDLTALTVLGGAIGLGLGFGLQKVISNFVSGIILLADRSIKPGDVIVVGDTYGWVKHLSARYVSLVTRDGKEHLIPNELLITERVENWSHTDNYVRIRIPLGISYNADVRRALELMLEAAAECPRVLSRPTPNALLRGFGDSSVDLELRLWIDDPSEGVGNVQSDVLLRIWDKFHANGVEIPFPQRDVHIRSAPPGMMAAEKAEAEGS